MAVILKRKKSTEADSVFTTGFSSVSIPTVLKWFAVAFGSVAVLGGMYSEKDKKATAPDAKVFSKEIPTAPNVLAKESVQAFYREAGKLHAALLSFEKDRGHFPPKISDVFPEYLSPGNSDSPPDWLRYWTFDGIRLIRGDISPDVCALMSPTGIIPTLDYGHNDLRCLSVDKSQKLVYHLNQKPQEKGFWHVQLKGTYANKLTSWVIIKNEGLTENCLGRDTLNDKITLSDQKPDAIIDLCLPAYAIEATANKTGLSLLENTEMLSTKFSLLEQPYSILINSQSCEFGKYNTTALSLVKGHKDAEKSTISCDLKATHP